MYNLLLKRKYRRTPVMLLILILMLSILPSYASAENEITDYVSFAKKVIESHYKNRDLGIDFDQNKAVIPELASFLDAKADVKQYSIKLNDNYITNYNITVNLMENKTIQDKIYLKFQVATSFNYIDLPNVDSGEGTIVEVLIDSKINKIVDMYDPYNYFDNSVRGVSVDILNDSNRFGLSKAGVAEAKRTELMTAIYDEYIQEKNSVYESDVLAPPVTTQGSWSYLDGNAISSYARNNYDKENPASGNGSVPYYDFSKISGNWDCTNFVSHALLAGGATVYDTGNSGISSTGWYYRSLSNRSSSWSGVTNLHDFVTSNTTKGPGGYSYPYSTKPGDLHVGDIVQFYNGSVWIHSTIVTGTYAIEERVGALVTGRSAYGQYNNNQKVGDMFPGHAKRILYVRNYN